MGLEHRGKNRSYDELLTKVSDAKKFQPSYDKPIRETVEKKKHDNVLTVMDAEKLLKELGVDFDAVDNYGGGIVYSKDGKIVAEYDSSNINIITYDELAKDRDKPATDIPTPSDRVTESTDDSIDIAINEAKSMIEKNDILGLTRSIKKNFGLMYSNAQYIYDSVSRKKIEVREAINTELIKESKHFPSAVDLKSDVGSKNVSEARFANESTIDRDAMFYKEKNEHPEFDDVEINQIVDDHISAGKDIIYRENSDYCDACDSKKVEGKCNCSENQIVESDDEKKKKGSEWKDERSHDAVVSELVKDVFTNLGDKNDRASVMAEVEFCTKHGLDGRSDASAIRYEVFKKVMRKIKNAAKKAEEPEQPEVEDEEAKQTFERISEEKDQHFIKASSIKGSPKKGESIVVNGRRLIVVGKDEYPIGTPGYWTVGVNEGFNDKDDYTIIARGISDRAVADELAKEKEGQVSTDDTDKEKFMIVKMKEKKVNESDPYDVTEEPGYVDSGVFDWKHDVDDREKFYAKSIKRGYVVYQYDSSDDQYVLYSFKKALSPDRLEALNLIEYDGMNESKVSAEPIDLQIKNLETAIEMGFFKTDKTRVDAKKRLLALKNRKSNRAVKEGYSSEYQLTKEPYDWGILRKIGVGPRGIDFSVIIHPEHWVEIQKVLNGSVDSIKFTDEQAKAWTVSASGENITFTSDRGNVSIPKSELSSQLSEACVIKPGQVYKFVDDNQEVSVDSIENSSVYLTDKDGEEVFMSSDEIDHLIHAGKLKKIKESKLNESDSNHQFDALIEIWEGMVEVSQGIGKSKMKLSDFLTNGAIFDLTQSDGAFSKSEAIHIIKTAWRIFSNYDRRPMLNDLKIANESAKRAPMKKLKENDTSKIGSGELPNKYYVTSITDFYVETTTGSLDWASDSGVIESTSNPLGVFDTYAEAKKKAEEVVNSFGEEPTEEGPNSVIIEDHVTGQVYQHGFVRYNSKYGSRFKIEIFEDVDFTKEKIEQSGQTFESKFPKVLGIPEGHHIGSVGLGHYIKLGEKKGRSVIECALRNLKRWNESRNSDTRFAAESVLNRLSVNTQWKKLETKETIRETSEKKINELAERLLIVNHLKERSNLSPDHKKFIEETSKIHLDDSMKELVFERFLDLLERNGNNHGRTH